MSRKKTFFICTVILLVGVLLTFLVFLTEPKAARGGATKETAMLVEVTRHQRGDFRPVITAMGVVEASRDIILSPQVGGRVKNLSSSFIPGGFVKKNEILLQLEPSDYENLLAQRQSTLRQATADLNIEKGRQNVARRDYQLFDEKLPGDQEKLILRKPQLNAAVAKVEAARAAEQQARLDLQRTGVKAPFDAHILDRNVNVGSQVSPGQNLGRLVGIDTYWVVTTIPPAKIRRLKFPRNNLEKGSPVRIRNRSAWEKEEFREGYLFKMVGALEKQTRLARILVAVPDPLAHKKESAGLPQMMIGSFVEVRIEAEVIPDVMRIRRDYIRKNDTVWIMENRKLHIRPVEIIFRDQTYAYISKGLGGQVDIVTTNLATVVEGAGLRLHSDIPRSSVSGTARGRNQ